MYAFSPDYTGDRVLALMAGLIGMVDAAFEHTQDFYVLDDLHEQSSTTARAMLKLPSGKSPRHAMPAANRCCWPMP